jgi:hypothetical protein
MRTVRPRVGPARVTPRCGPRDAGTSKVLKGGSIIAIASGRIAPAVA